MRKLLAIGIILIFTGILWANCQCNCFTVIVGKKASAEGAVLLAHNEDDGGDLLVLVQRVRAAKGDSPWKVRFYSGREVEVEPFRQEMLWFEIPEMRFGDSFVNESGVVIVSNACASKEPREPLEGGISYMLRRLAAERARSAREAVRIMGELVEKYGYDSNGRTYSIIDRREGWVFSVARGGRWVAQRVGDDKIMIIPNHYVIRKVDLSDRSRFMASKDLIDYAIKKGWYNPEKDGPFDFAKVYSRSLKSKGNIYRHWRALTLLAQGHWTPESDFPFQVKPKRKVSVRDLMNLLRDHYEGTPYYNEKSPNKSEYRPICVIHTKYSMVVENREDLPAPIATLVWFSLGKPDTSVFLPLYFGVDPLPKGLNLGDGELDYIQLFERHFNSTSLYLKRYRLFFTKIRLLEDLVEKDYNRRAEAVKRIFRPFEERLLKLKPIFEKTFVKLYREDPQLARSYLNFYFYGLFQQFKALVEKAGKTLPSNIEDKPCAACSH